MWKVFDMVSNLLFYDHNFSRGWRQSQPPLFWCKPSGEPPASQAIVKIAWAFTPGGCTDVVAGPDNNMVNLEKTFVRRYYRAARWDKRNGPRWCKSPKDGGVKPSGVRIIWVGYLGRGRNSWKIFKAKFGRDIKNAVSSLLLMARKIMSFTSGTVNTITGIGIEIFCICVRQKRFWHVKGSAFDSVER